jgi:hypothetical protein
MAQVQSFLVVLLRLGAAVGVKLWEQQIPMHLGRPSVEGGSQPRARSPSGFMAATHRPPPPITHSTTRVGNGA